MFLARLELGPGNEIVASRPDWVQHGDVRNAVGIQGAFGVFLDAVAFDFAPVKINQLCDPMPFSSRDCT